MKTNDTIEGLKSTINDLKTEIADLKEERSRRCKRGRVAAGDLEEQEKRFYYEEKLARLEGELQIAKSDLEIAKKRLELENMYQKSNKYKH